MASTFLVKMKVSSQTYEISVHMAELGEFQGRFLGFHQIQGLTQTFITIQINNLQVLSVQLKGNLH